MKFLDQILNRASPQIEPPLSIADRKPLFVVIVVAEHRDLRQKLIWGWSCVASKEAILGSLVENLRAEHPDFSFRYHVCIEIPLADDLSAEDGAAIASPEQSQ